MRDEIFVALKKVIKSRGLNYKELASEIDMSESGFKKLMASKDCSMSKLDQICETLNLSLGDLITLSEEMDKTKLSFNSKQEELFLKKPHYYHFFTELMGNEYDWEKVRSIFNLSIQECQSVLRALDKVDLIEFGPGDKVKGIFFGTDISISAELGAKVSFGVDRSFVDFAQEQFKMKKKTCHGARGSFYLKKESLAELLKAFDELATEFAKRARREELTYGRKELELVTHMTYVACGFRSSDYVFNK